MCVCVCVCVCVFAGVVCLGLKTGLVEKFDFASGTSSRSTKLIHGGVRYLQKAVFNLDIEQVSTPIALLMTQKKSLCDDQCWAWQKLLSMVKTEPLQFSWTL